MVMGTAVVATAMITTTTSASVIDFKMSVIGWSVNGAGSSVSSINVRISRHINLLRRVGQHLPKIDVRRGSLRASRSVLKQSAVADVEISGYRAGWGV
jgi:hypothetical protein